MHMTIDPNKKKLRVSLLLSVPPTEDEFYLMRIGQEYASNSVSF